MVLIIEREREQKFPGSEAGKPCYRVQVLLWVSIFLPSKQPQQPQQLNPSQTQSAGPVLVFSESTITHISSIPTPVWMLLGPSDSSVGFYSYSLACTLFLKYSNLSVIIKNTKQNVTGLLKMFQWASTINGEKSKFSSDPW